MNTMKKTAAGAVLGGALLAAGGLGLAHAAPPAQPLVNDGKVDVTVSANNQEIGVLQNVSVANAEALVNATCPTVGITTEALDALDKNGTEVPGGACTSTSIGGGTVTYSFAQNAPGNSENAPGQNKPASAIPSSSSTQVSPSNTPAS